MRKRDIGLQYILTVSNDLEKKMLGVSLPLPKEINKAELELG